MYGRIIRNLKLGKYYYNKDGGSPAYATKDMVDLSGRVVKLRRDGSYYRVVGVDSVRQYYWNDGMFVCIFKSGVEYA